MELKGYAAKALAEVRRKQLREALKTVSDALTTSSAYCYSTHAALEVLYDVRAGLQALNTDTLSEEEKKLVIDYIQHALAKILTLTH